MQFLRQHHAVNQQQQQPSPHPLQSLQSVAVSAGGGAASLGNPMAPHAQLLDEAAVSAASSLCFCPLHRGFHNSWTVYGLGPDGAVHFNPLMGREFAK